MQAAAIDIRGFKVFKTALSPDQQARIVADIRKVVAAASLFSPETPYGKRMSVRMTSAGRVGWYADTRGYRYALTHPGGQS